MSGKPIELDRWLTYAGSAGQPGGEGWVRLSPRGVQEGQEVDSAQPPVPNPQRGMCERPWYSVLPINMQATHAILLWAAHDGRNANDVISARRPADMRGRSADSNSAQARFGVPLCVSPGPACGMCRPPRSCQRPADRCVWRVTVARTSVPRTRPMGPLSQYMARRPARSRPKVATASASMPATAHAGPGDRSCRTPCTFSDQYTPERCKVGQQARPATAPATAGRFLVEGG